MGKKGTNEKKEGGVQNYLSNNDIDNLGSLNVGKPQEQGQTTRTSARRREDEDLGLAKTVKKCSKYEVNDTVHFVMKYLKWKEMSKQNSNPNYVMKTEEDKEGLVNKILSKREMRALTTKDSNACNDVS